MFHCPVRQTLLVTNLLYVSTLYEAILLPLYPLKGRLAFKLRRWLLTLSVRSADVVMTPTQAMLTDLRRFVEVSPKKALVNPFGTVQPDSFPTRDRTATGSRAPSAGRAVRLLYVSLYYDHKNLGTLLKALPLLNTDGARNCILRTTVNPAWQARGAFAATSEDDRALAQHSDVSRWVEFVGPVETSEVQGLYRGADLFVFPSLAESFGLPMVEAMSYGLPIVAADTPVNREVCENAALYFNPLDARDCASQVRRVIDDEALRVKLIEEGSQRKEFFKWQNHIERLLKAFGEMEIEDL